MNNFSITEIMADPKRSQTLALALGFVGSLLLAIGIGIEANALFFVGLAILISSGAVWAIRGVMEDRETEN